MKTVTAFCLLLCLGCGESPEHEILPWDSAFNLCVEYTMLSYFREKVEGMNCIGAMYIKENRTEYYNDQAKKYCNEKIGKYEDFELKGECGDSIYLCISRLDMDCVNCEWIPEPTIEDICATYDIYPVECFDGCINGVAPWEIPDYYVE